MASASSANVDKERALPPSPDCSTEHTAAPASLSACEAEHTAAALASLSACEAEAAPNPYTAGRATAYLILHAIAKKANVGAIVRSAVALGVTQLILIGDKELSTHGSFGAGRFLTVRRFPRLRVAIDWLRSRGVAVCGIELAAGALPIASHPFRGDTAFLAGNEGAGIPLAHRELCDYFVYIPQHSTGTASLNVATAVAIVLSHFADWADYSEAPRDSEGREKYAVIAPPQRRGPASGLDFEKQRLRAAAATAAAAAALAAVADAQPSLGTTLDGAATATAADGARGADG